ncbi:MAG: uroporphyrinogen decarboxylase family protein [Methylococcaceae bacterium]|nr:uroporphyrinogen decarboxylase family protein [Methylococcaceae bacterium]
MRSSREQVLGALAGERLNLVPFIIWDNKLPSPEIEQRLIELGACIIVKSTVWHSHLDGIEVRRDPLPPTADGHARTRTVYRTPAGEVSEIHIRMPGTSWLEKHLFERPDNYDALEFLLQTRRYTPAFDVFRASDNRYPGACLARPVTVHSPMHEVIYEIMGIERFCLEWADNRERVLRLVQLMAADVDRRVQLLAECPAQICVIDGNTEISIVGLSRYREFYLPHIERACRILHAAGKYAGAHLDGNNRLIVNEVAGTALDFIESFTPPPDCDLPLGDARRAWPEKTFMINFPSSLHHQGPVAIRAHTRQLLEESAGDGRRFMVGVMEDVPNRGLDTIVPLAEEVATWKL